MPLSLADIIGAFVLAAAYAAILYGSELILTRVERWIEEDVMPVVMQTIDAWAGRRL